MIPESAARRVACLAGHVTQGQEHATTLNQQVETNSWQSNPPNTILTLIFDQTLRCRTVLPSTPCNMQGHAPMWTSSMPAQHNLR